ncbi:hypothetical protein [Nocardioides sp.]|uniref:hypothetical protein n=1 Tax=Nocardioides sp. TaxID=35761 RepID=UPI002BF41303|nr:hypothetical protein [Nocardioides sp.]HXH77454.1 hypothetical protein [Nocardioides sp.]
MPTITAETSTKRTLTRENPSSLKRSEPSLYARYVGAMLYFVGAALIAGAVVHYPIDPPVYSVICIVGAMVFLLGTVVNEFVFAPVRPTLRRAIALVTFSLLLSFGVGLLGGGIQHFEQFPERSAAMTPIGLLMSYAAFVAKDAQGRWRDLFSLFGAAVALVALVTWFGMSALADSMDSSSHDHGQGTQNAPVDNAPADDAAGDKVPGDDAPAEQNDAPAGEAPEHSDSDSHDH